jgi:large subunit ribosomal protein L13
MKTFSPRPQDIERRWYVIDADGAVLGRVASEVAKLLRGKHKPIFAPHADTGDHVIVINARGVVVTGGKEEKKIYYRHSGYPGGLTETSYARLLAQRPRLAVEKAVRGMLPKNRLGRQMFRKLVVYEGPEHPHVAQQPVILGLGEVPAWDGLPTPKPKPARPAKAEPDAKGSRRSRAKASTAKGAGGSRPKATGPKGRASAPAPATARSAARTEPTPDADVASEDSRSRAPRAAKPRAKGGASKTNPEQTKES